MEKPVWLYPPGHWRDERHALSEEHDELRAELASEVQRLRNAVEFGLNS